MVYNSKTIRRGLFIPKYPQKYIGDSTKIVYRSNLERRFFKIIDENKDIIGWASEEFHIPYISPIDGKGHRYFVDLIIKTSKNETFIVEIKPFAFTQPPKIKNRNKQNVLNETIQYVTNEAKWNAAKKWSEEKGWKFIIVTEKSLGNVK